MDKFCLKWNDFQSNIYSSFKELRQDTDLTDVTITCEDNQSLEAHKVILSASSPVFKDIIKQNKHPHPLIYMKGMKAKDLVSIIDFIYYGEVNIYQEDLRRFLNSAADLQIKGLAENLGKEEDISKTFNQDSNSKEDIIKSNKQCLPVEKEEIVEHDLDSVNEPQEEEEIIMPNLNLKENFDELNSRIDNMMEKINGVWNCKVCGKTSGIYKSHMRNHIEALHMEVSHPCNQCGNSFRSRNTRASHIKSVHK